MKLQSFGIYEKGRLGASLIGTKNELAGYFPARKRRMGFGG
jgi:hypothetical protein